MDIAVFAGIAVTVVALVVGLPRLLETRRSRDLARVATERGLLFEPAGEPLAESEAHSFARFRHGQQKARNIMRGTMNGAELTVFDHTALRQHRLAHETVAAFRANAPDFQLSTLRHGVNPNVMTPVFARLGFTVMCFDSHPEFCRDYLLLARDENSLRGVFTPALLGFLDHLDKSRRWAVESASGWLLVCSSGQRVRPQDLASFLNEAAALAAAIASRGESAAATA